MIVYSEGKAIYVPSDGQAKSWPFSGGSARETRLHQPRSIELLGLGVTEAYGALYASQPFVYALVNKLSRGIARLPLEGYARMAGRQQERLDVAHPLEVLLAEPYPRGSTFDLVEATVGNLAIYGNALWWKWRPGPGQPPEELWPLDWRYVTIKTAKSAPIGVFEYDGPAGRKLMLPDDVVHFRWWSPKGDQGTSPLEPLRTTLALEDAGRRYAVSSFAHGARPSGALVTPKTLEPHQKEELRAEVQSLNAGPDNAFRIALMDGGMEWRPFAHTAQEAETIAHRKLNQVEACAVYDVPPPVVHILDRATFANVTEQNKALYRETLGPPTEKLAQTVDAQLIRGEPAFLGTFVKLNMDEVLQADLEKRAVALKSMETTLSLNERRAVERKRPIGNPTDEKNPANGVMLPLNMAVVLPDGTLISTGGTPGGQLAGALSAEVDLAVARALEERDRIEQLELEPEPVPSPSD